MKRWNKTTRPHHLWRAPCTRHLCWCWPRTPRREWCLTMLEVSSLHVRCIFCHDLVFWLHYCSRWQLTNVVSDLLLTYCLFRQKRRLHCLWHVWPGQVQEPVGALLQRLPGMLLLTFMTLDMSTLQGIIFVVDSSDRLRMVVAKDELDMLLQVL